MNEKIVNIAIFLFFIMLGINGFLAYTMQLQLEDGSSFNEFYGLTNSGLSKNTIETEGDGITFVTSSTEGISSTDPSTEQGVVTPQNDAGTPAAFSAWNFAVVMAIGVELVMGKFAAMFPFLAPITTAVTAFAIALKVFFAGFIALNIRSFLGRRI